MPCKSLDSTRGESAHRFTSSKAFRKPAQNTDSHAHTQAIRHSAKVQDELDSILAGMKVQVGIKELESRREAHLVWNRDGQAEAGEMKGRGRKLLEMKRGEAGWGQSYGRGQTRERLPEARYTDLQSRHECGRGARGLRKCNSGSSMFVRLALAIAKNPTTRLTPWSTCGQGRGRSRHHLES